jgi:uncharacterized protein YgiM (DUF1202 family)
MKMDRKASLGWGMLLLLILLMAGACQQPAYYPPPVYYYVTPPVTYLRDCPSYDCGVTTNLYSGDQVEFLDRNEYGWDRVRVTRTGAVGWIPEQLLSPAPVPPVYYVALNTVYLRDCADYNCRSLELLYRGDRVEKIEQNYLGWWRVKSNKTGNIGWVPASALSPTPGPPYYYVNVTSLALRAGPSTGSKILTTLGFNQQVEWLGLGPGGWAQVRDTRTGIIGWAAARYLESFPVSYPKPVYKKPKAGAKKAAPKEEEEAPAPTPAKPKAM